jgi:predicted house-cleaning NTP pyrophosphatase (Maf/HAM1 superfamily)
MVKALMGKTHEFVTATTIIYLKSLKSPKSLSVVNRWEDISTSYVTTRTMTEAEIDQYVTRYDFTHFAAAYTLNDSPWDWITKIDGSYTNVIGLPFEVILPILRRLKLLR